MLFIAKDSDSFLFKKDERKCEQHENDHIDLLSDAEENGPHSKNRVRQTPPQKPK